MPEAKEDDYQEGRRFHLKNKIASDKLLALLRKATRTTLPASYRLMRSPWKRKPLPTVIYVPPGGFGANFPLWEVLRSVCKEFGVGENAIRSKGRTDARAIDARRAFYYRAARIRHINGPHVGEPFYSIPQIGVFIGKDHSTVHFGISQYCVTHNVPWPRPSMYHGLITPDPYLAVARKAEKLKQLRDKKRAEKALGL